MARALIVGCGCRGRMLAEGLLQRGWQVRGTTRREGGLARIEAAGIESALADPADPGSVLDLVADVAVIAWLLGSAEGTPAELAALHVRALDRVLEGIVETPVRGFVYEAAGTVDSDLLVRGREAVEAASATWRLPFESFAVDPSDSAAWGAPQPAWAETAIASVTGLLGRAGTS